MTAATSNGSDPGADPGADPGVLGAALEGDVRAVLRAVRGTNVEELRLAWGDVRIVVRRDLQSAAGGPPAAQPADPAAAGGPPEAPPTEVRAHMVGPFHRSRQAEGPVLANEGDLVEPGRALGVIETLGMATEVEAPAAGRLERFLVEDGQPVEFGQPLAVIVAPD
ncbi:MAG TPA: biotin/lipoyl-containing protein [Chloroflexota bacterium]|nr:biotin/lipoyl-containing protein [Chloroflexota bacterium]